jgi:hypothetical protein
MLMGPPETGGVLGDQGQEIPELTNVIIQKAQVKEKVSFLPPPSIPSTGGKTFLGNQLAAQNAAAGRLA